MTGERSQTLDISIFNPEFVALTALPKFAHFAFDYKR